MTVDSIIDSYSNLIVERYRIERLLGVGGMGNVYLVVDTMLGDERVALKVLKEELCQDPNHTKRFLREVSLTRKVTHPNVVRTFDAGSVNGRLFFTMEFIKGKTLKEKLCGQPTTPLETATMILEIARGLSAIHEQEIVHRDLKLTNVLVTDDGTIKITDFGVARPGINEISGGEEIVGSATHMAPEVWQSGDVTPYTDLYSLGVIAYEMATGMVPFEGNTPHEVMWKHIKARPVAPMDIVQAVPEWLNYLIMQLLAKRPTDRPTSAKEVINRIEDKLKSSGAKVVVSDWEDDGSSGADHPPAPPSSRMYASAIHSALETSGVHAQPPPAATGILNFAFNMRPAPLEVPSEVHEKKIAAPRVVGKARKRYTREQMEWMFARVSHSVLGITVATLMTWILVEIVGTYAGVFLMQAKDTPTAGMVTLSFVSSLALYSLLTTIPLLIFTSLNRSVPTAIKVWIKTSKWSLCIFSALIALNFTRLMMLSYITRTGSAVDIALSALEGSFNNIFDAAFLIPFSPVYKTTVISNIPSLAQIAERDSLWVVVPIIVSIAYALAIVNVLRHFVSRGAKYDKLFMTASIALFIGLICVGEELLAPKVIEILALSKSIALSFSIGSHDFQFTPVRIIGATFNWFIAIAIIAHFLNSEWSKEKENIDHTRVFRK